MTDAGLQDSRIDQVPGSLLREMEDVAVDLARLAGAEIERALGRTLAVRYKSGEPEDAAPADPVSEVDRLVEVLIRARVADRFPEHHVLGEEIDESARGRYAFVWVVDPIDGTLNFINRFPLFSASVGLLHYGRPIVGALWCSATHALRPGVYHAQRGGAAVCFDGERMDLRRNPAVRRHLVGEPRVHADGSVPWDARTTGSAAIECAFVAAGLLRAAYFERPNVWDVGGGLVLAEAAGGDVRTYGPAGWVPFESFEQPASAGPDDPLGLRAWRQPVVLGEAGAVELLCRRAP